MDAPLLLAPLLNANEVARQAFNIETVTTLPIAFYEKTLVGVNPKEIEDLVPTLHALAVLRHHPLHLLVEVCLEIVLRAESVRPHERRNVRGVQVENPR